MNKKPTKKRKNKVQIQDLQVTFGMSLRAPGSFSALSWYKDVVRSSWDMIVKGNARICAIQTSKSTLTGTFNLFLSSLSQSESQKKRIIINICIMMKPNK
jgi:hypothetical protein